MLKLSALAIFLVVGCSAANGQRAKSAVLPANKALSVLAQCSRPSPETFEGTWEPSPDQLLEMEVRLDDISKLKAKDCCLVGGRIEKPADYYMQYVGLILKGKRAIYINAFTASGIKQLERRSDGAFDFVESDAWTKSAIVVCDGGPGYWGVLYDPKRHKFFDLAINGMG